jgi:bifunctional DNA-binding transcriptional regulator/antitoxin component of YhaV-PrlF toxin-antitoxin module
MQFITFPDDLLEAANLKEGDQIEWVDKGDGSFLLKKSWSDPYRDKMLAAGYKMVDGVWTLKKVPQTYDEMITAGYTMTDDGFWIKEN